MLVQHDTAIQTKLQPYVLYDILEFRERERERESCMLIIILVFLNIICLQLYQCASKEDFCV